MIDKSILETLSFRPNSCKHETPAWIGHLPFANLLVRELEPKLIVELGTHLGNSYFTFCQTIQENKLPSYCYAVDTWQGEEHAGFYDDSAFHFVHHYNEENYAQFSQLLRTTFDDAVHQFDDYSIELLHIDGLHTYEAVKNDFETWLPKVKEGGVILFHDTHCRHEDFGVWKLWEELQKKYPHTLDLKNSHGLGVLVNTLAPPSNQLLADLTEQSKEQSWQELLSTAGNHLQEHYRQETQIARLQNSLNEERRLIADLNSKVQEKHLIIQERDNTIQERDNTIQERDNTIQERDEKIAHIHKSFSWKLTAPLRALRRLLTQRTTAF